MKKIWSIVHFEVVEKMGSIEFWFKCFYIICSKLDDVMKRMTYLANIEKLSWKIGPNWRTDPSKILGLQIVWTDHWAFGPEWDRLSISVSLMELKGVCSLY
jgi:hypothetical protein